MNREKFYEMLDLLDDSLVLESAEVKRKTWRWRLTVIGIILTAIVGVWLISTYPVRHPTDSLEGDLGVIQEDAYYAYAGSGFVLPNQVRVPQGLVRYVPGEGRELLVSVKDHPLNVLFPCWGVNSHGLYYIDSATNQLWRMDLETREEVLLFDPGQAETSKPEAAPEETDVWGLLGEALTGERSAEDVAETLGMDPQSAMMVMDAVEEDTVTATYYSGTEEYTITLDSRTGEVLSRVPGQDGSDRTLTVGERTLHLVRMDYTEGFTYPGWETEQEMGMYCWYDLQEDGVSLLPQGTREMGVTAMDGGLLVSYSTREVLDENGNYDPRPTGNLFLTEGGEIYDVPQESDGVWMDCRAHVDGWLYYYSDGDWENPDPSQRAAFLGAWNLTTGENRRLLQPFRYPDFTTDGHWLYASNDSRTNCYTIDLDAQGDPCGLTLVEEDI